MCARADSIDDVDVLRSGGMKTLFDAVYTPSTIGMLLREFTFGHTRQLDLVLRAHLISLCERVAMLPGIEWLRQPASTKGLSPEGLGKTERKR